MRKGLFEVGEAGFDGGIGDSEGGFHVADATFAENEDAEEVEVVFGESGEFVGVEVAGHTDFTIGAMKGCGGHGTLAGGAADGRVIFHERNLHINNICVN